ncbi:MAG: gamma-butyrobetaine dioxygenase [Acidimicrobiaceae bacterium]|nr:gamma-butyrobetaine dioxygenase [Acidimicrobiaceae bacterium]
MSRVDEIATLFASEGAADYLGEAVSQAEHMRQTGWLAKSAGAPNALIAAALLHDVGHFQGAITGRELMEGVDNRHSESGARWLGQWFDADVTEPVRLHVAAKRYLCLTEPGYLAELSVASRYTLSVQGGPMDEIEARGFEDLSWAADALALRRWDEQAKDPEAGAPGFEAFRPLLERLMGRA